MTSDRSPARRFTSVRAAVLAGALIVGSTVGPAGASAGSVEGPHEPSSSDARAVERRSAVGDRSPDLEQLAAERGRLRVIVELSTPGLTESSISRWQDIVAHRAAVAADRAAVEAALADTGSTVVRRFRFVPGLVVSATPAGLRALEASPAVARIREDRRSEPLLNGTTVIVQADQMWSSGYDGAGQAVAILDSGVDSTHPMFSDGAGGTRVVAEACYSTTDAGWASSSLCPGGVAEATGPGAGTDCGAIDGCDHGTHVAGIAAGGPWTAGATAISGVAPAADIIAVQVFSRFDDLDFCGTVDPCIASWDSDQVSGLEFVYGLRTTHEIAAANMSLGGGRATSACAGEPQEAIIGLMKAADIATVIAAGNDGWSDAVGYPSCIPDAVTVGSTTNGDLVSIFSDTHPTIVDLYAPGSAILSALPDGGFASWNGTSMATPHVAGAWALMKDALGPSDDESVDGILALLQSTGTPVSTREGPTALGFSHPRINVRSAFDAASRPLLSVDLAGVGSGTVTSSPAGIDCGSTCFVEVPTSTTYVLTAAAAEGSEFVGWSGGGCSGTSTCSVTVTESVQITATFDPIGPPNDDFASAQDLGVLPATFDLKTSGATTEASEPTPLCDGLAAASVWYAWTPGVDGYLIVDTIGSDYDTVLAAYSGASLGTLVEEGCNYGTPYDNYFDAAIVVPVFGGVPISVQVSGYSGATGSLVLNATFLPSTYRPDNDDFSSAETLVDPGPIEVMTAGATDEPSEPTPSCDPDAASSVWFEWTAPSAGTVTVDTLGSKFDTVLSAYTGSALASLTEIACDFGTEENEYTDATVSFAVTAGSTYRFQVTGLFGIVGSLAVNTTFVPSEVTFELSVSVSGDGSVVSSPVGVSCPGDCSESFADGTSVTLTAAAQSGAAFSGWGGACSGSASTCVVSMTQVRSVSATFARVPGAPAGVSGVAGDEAVTVSWSAPVDDGGVAISGYTVTASPGGATCGWSSGPLSCVVSGLVNGTEYTFSVVAANAVGLGVVSVPSAGVTPGGVGLLRVSTSPAVPSRVVVNGVPRSDWGLDWVSMPVGGYEVCFSDVVGFRTPLCESVVVVDGVTTVVEGVFEPLGVLRVGVEPAGVPTTVSVDGEWRNEYGLFAFVEPGEREVCWSSVADFVAPVCEVVSVSAGVLSEVTGVFVSSPGAPGVSGEFGFLRVTSSPAVPTRVVVDGVPRGDWGLDWVKVPVGVHTVCFAGVTGFVAPGCEVVSVSLGETTVVEGVFEPLGLLRVVVEPGGLAVDVVVDGFPVNQFGLYTFLEAGEYLVCSTDVVGWVNVTGCRSVVVVAGSQTDHVVSYEPLSLAGSLVGSLVM